MENEEHKLIEVKDLHGNVYLLVNEIDSGGQGAVYTTEDPTIIVKQVFAEASENEKYLRKFRNIRCHELEEIGFASPLSILAPPHIGYLMRMLRDMMPIKRLIAAAGEKNLAEFYIHTGGLLKRLKVLKRFAQSLSQLHFKGLVYCDISPNNIFVSEGTEHSQLWLIDADNIEHDSQTTHTMMTPDYGAPEFFQGMGHTIYSDAYSFAILAYQVLNSQHPFKGAAFESDEGSDDDWADSTDIIEEKQEPDDLLNRGMLPWVEDSTDSSNNSKFGIPSSITLSKGMRALFVRTFEEGRQKISARPSMFEWVEALGNAIDMTVRCANPECNTSFFLAEKCPFCSTTRNPKIYLQVRRNNPDEANPDFSSNDGVYRQMALDLDENGKAVLSASLFSNKQTDDESWLEFETLGNTVLLTANRNLEDWHLIYNDKKISSFFKKSIRFELNEGRIKQFHLCSPDMDKLSRTISLTIL